MLEGTPLLLFYTSQLMLICMKCGGMGPYVASKDFAARAAFDTSKRHVMSSLSAAAS